MILYENMASFELSLGNIHSASDIFRTLVTKESGFVEGWMMLLLLYIRHSSMDAIVKIAEEAIHKCESDVVLVYYYSNWLCEKVTVLFTFRKELEVSLKITFFLNKHSPSTDPLSLSSTRLFKNLRFCSS